MLALTPSVVAPYDRMQLVTRFVFFSSRRRHTRLQGDWSSDVCSSDLVTGDRHRLRDRHAPKPPGSRQFISPFAAVFEIAPAKVLHGAVRLHGLASSPTPDRKSVV